MYELIMEISTKKKTGRHDRAALVVCGWAGAVKEATQALWQKPRRKNAKNDRTTYAVIILL